MGLDAGEGMCLAPAHPGACQPVRLPPPHLSPTSRSTQSYTNAEMEDKLKRRLRKIERTLMRDDEYRRIQMGAMNEASQCVPCRAALAKPLAHASTLQTR